MSEEAAFLEVLKANPVDDVARLVYADWLDDHDEPAKAEYLRLVAAIAQHESCIPILPEAIQLLRITENLPVEWREQAGSRFALLLESWTDKLRAIKWIREATGDGLGEAKAASENLPHLICDSVLFEVIVKTYNRGVEHGLGLRITSGPLDLSHQDMLHDLVIRAIVYRSGRHLTRAARVALAEVLVAALGIPAEEANELAKLDRDITVATSLTLQEARKRRVTLEQKFVSHDWNRGWYLQLSRRTTTSNNP